MKFEDVLNDKGILIYTNVGISMMPLIREGKDLMVIEKINAPLKKYDAVLFRRPYIKGRGEYVLHRITKVYDDGSYYIIGDNCESGERVLKENIIGILTGLKRNGKTLNVNNTFYKLYVKIWYLIFPIRLVYKKGKRLFYKCGSFVKRKVLRIK